MQITQGHAQALLCLVVGCSGIGRSVGNVGCVVSLSVASDEYLHDALRDSNRCFTVSFFARDIRTSRIANELSSNVATSPGELENLLTLSPTLVLGSAWSQLTHVAQQYNVPTLTIADAQTLEQVARQTEQLDVAVAPRVLLAPSFRERLARERQSFAATPLCTLGRVLFYNPTLRSAAGTGTMLNEVLETVAGPNHTLENALHRRGHHVLSEEDIVRMDPDIVIVIDYRADAQRADQPSSNDLPLDLWRRNRLRTQRSAQTFVFDSALALTTSHRVLDTVRALYQQCQSLCR